MKATRSTYEPVSVLDASAWTTCNISQLLPGSRGHSDLDPKLRFCRPAMTFSCIETKRSRCGLPVTICVVPGATK
jgi:hypothetical protein